MKPRRRLQECQHKPCFYAGACIYQQEIQHKHKPIPNPFWGALKTVFFSLLFALVVIGSVWVYVQLGGGAK